MAITAAQVKELREATGVGMMECKKALTETNGDFDKAMEWLRKKGIASAEKKAGRVAAEGVVESYIHMGGKIGVLVELKSAGNVDVLQELAFNLSMQVAASKPQVVAITDVDPAQVQSEREILTVQARNEGKPEAVITKMVEGRIHKYYKEVCLLEQEYVRDGSFSIKQVVAQAAKDAGAEIVVTRFVRYEMGEGIEKRQDNFAAEIAEQLKGL